MVSNPSDLGWLKYLSNLTSLTGHPLLHRNNYYQVFLEYLAATSIMESGLYNERILLVSVVFTP